MRIPIREQLALLVLTSTLVALAIISIATWVNNYNFVVGIISQGLALTASLKAAQLTSNLELLQSTCGTITTRLLIQQALQQFYGGDHTDANWAVATGDVVAGLESFEFVTLLQSVIFPREAAGNTHGLLNVTKSSGVSIRLPYSHPDGTAVMLGDVGIGYPPMLYPNLTYSQSGGVNGSIASKNVTQVYAYPDLLLDTSSSLLLGPLHVNSTFAILSLTLPIINTTSANDLLGFMTVVASASGLSSVLSSTEGISESTAILLLGPARAENRFSLEDRPLASASGAGVNTTALQSAQVGFLFSPETYPAQSDRHSIYNENSGSSFPLRDYPLVLYALSTPNPEINNATSQLSTTNEQGASVAVGVARPQTTLVDWVLILEGDHGEAFAPTVRLRNILLTCVFGTAGLVALLVVPVAHLSVLPIQRLKEATKVSVQTTGFTSVGNTEPWDSNDLRDAIDGDGNALNSVPRPQPSPREKFLTGVKNVWYSGRWKSTPIQEAESGSRKFRLPGKVEEKKHFVTDELTELTSTFNEVSDELMIHYTKLEEKVLARTLELETSKKAAEAANESKTLFIASISHELKTPLNGILGMCAVCMAEDDLSRVKQSLEVIYKSGDLLLHLLTDLLTFSKNQIGQSLSLEEGEFNLSEIKSQIVSLFDKQVRESKISFDFQFVGTASIQPEMSSMNASGHMLAAFGPPGTGRLKDMRLWGDTHRILQVMINLVSNSLKFTLEGGKVEVRIRCVGDVTKSSNNSRKDSHSSKGGSQRTSIARRGSSVATTTLVDSKSQAGPVNPSKMKGVPSVLPASGRTSTPPSVNSRTLLFEFEVEDNGPGIPSHLQQSIFEPFVQGDIGLTKKYGGTGLGLSICSQLSELLGGEIALKSTVGVGTTFTLRIPLRLIEGKVSRQSSTSPGSSRPSMLSADDSHAKAIGKNSSARFDAESQPRLVGLSQPFFASAIPLSSGVGSRAQNDAPDLLSSSRNTSKFQVLIAEDNLVNQEVVVRMLNLENIHDVTVAGDGKKAYKMVQDSMEKSIAYDLIFMDIQMPNLDGLQSTRLIRQIGYTGPIVALTAFAEESNIKDCIDAGMDMFLSKPIRRPALKQVLDRFARSPEG